MIVYYIFMERFQAKAVYFQSLFSQALRIDFSKKVKVQQIYFIVRLSSYHNTWNRFIPPYSGNSNTGIQPQH